MSRTLRIVSRGSELALWQSRAVESAIQAQNPGLQVEIRVIRTTGDRILDVPLAKIGDKGLFTKELDHALLRGDADIAVHSLKDVPTRLPDGLSLVAVTEREDPRDVLLSAGPCLSDLPPGGRVGTSSLRRRAQLRALRPDLQVLDLRGNLNTRRAKLESGEYDAIILAAAGVLRLGWKDLISAYLEPPSWLPAVGQGALGVVAREGDTLLRTVLKPLHDSRTASCTAAERALLRMLEGGCQIPIGALATWEEGRVRLDAVVADLEGEQVVRASGEGEAASAVALGERIGGEMIKRGAAEILERIRGESGGRVSEPASP